MGLLEGTDLSLSLSLSLFCTLDKPERARMCVCVCIHVHRSGMVHSLERCCVLDEARRIVEASRFRFTGEHTGLNNADPQRWIDMCEPVPFRSERSRIRGYVALRILRGEEKQVEMESIFLQTFQGTIRRGKLEKSFRVAKRCGYYQVVSTVGQFQLDKDFFIGVVKVEQHSLFARNLESKFIFSISIPFIFFFFVSYRSLDSWILLFFQFGCWSPKEVTMIDGSL